MRIAFLSTAARVALVSMALSAAMGQVLSAQPVFVGYIDSSADPNKVGVGGVWDFDSWGPGGTSIGATDSMQYWRPLPADWHFDRLSIPAPENRPKWHLWYGNEVSAGNTNLWRARGLGGRVFYRRHGVAGVWHRDPMTGLPGSSGPISGSFSAWCGLRAPGDDSVRDELTNNPFNGTLASQWGGPAGVQTAWPGYGDQWDQMMYHDIQVPVSGTSLSFQLRTRLSTQAEADDRWFTPSPTTLTHLTNTAPVDSFLVWIGRGKEVGVFDTNRRWLDEIIHFNLPDQDQPILLYARSGNFDGVVNLVIPYLAWPVTRIVFQVKTNRRSSDESGFDSADGAAVVDDIVIASPAQTWDFESAGQLRPRQLVDAIGQVTDVAPLNAWIATGRPENALGHVDNMIGLIYEATCPTCLDPYGNVLLLGDHDTFETQPIETWSAAISPTIRFDSGNPQGTHADVVLAGKTKVSLIGELYLGRSRPDVSGVMCRVGVRYFSSAQTQPQGAGVAGWSTFHFPPGEGIYDTRLGQCLALDEDLTSLLPPLSQVDSIQVAVTTVTRCERFGSVACGEVYGMYFDDLRLKFEEPAAAPVRRRDFAQKGGR